jgi:hypothetical protein
VGAAGIQDALDGIKPPTITVPYRYQQKGPGLPGGDGSGDTPPPGDVPGHAAGGVFASEHLARIAEGGQPEIVGSVDFMRRALAGAIRDVGRTGAVTPAGAQAITQTLVFKLDERTVSEVVARGLPRVVLLQGAG